jgi:Ubiquitin carboxyl-terminal hydrolase
VYSSSAIADTVYSHWSWSKEQIPSHFFANYHQELVTEINILLQTTPHFHQDIIVEVLPAKEDVVVRDLEDRVVAWFSQNETNWAQHHHRLFSLCQLKIVKPVPVKATFNSTQSNAETKDHQEPGSNYSGSANLPVVITAQGPSRDGINGIIGLNNNGNTCYMNAALQMLYTGTDYMVSGKKNGKPRRTNLPLSNIINPMTSCPLPRALSQFMKN